MFAAVAAAGGYLLIAIPNVEAFTVALFLAGWALGLGSGTAAATVAAVLYFGFNPQGGFFPPLLIAQIVGAIAAPVAGAALRKLQPQKTALQIYLIIAAFIVTLWFDILTNLAFPLTAGFDARGVIATLIAGIPFAVIHIGSNILIFALLAPSLIELLKSHRF
ncbi:MAG: hypothetical protein FJY65_03950 [Calditrichaeota bacterium]|nr:hypothetical protein [Calditrichota bacterium]